MNGRFILSAVVSLSVVACWGGYGQRNRRRPPQPSYRSTSSNAAKRAANQNFADYAEARAEIELWALEHLVSPDCDKPQWKSKQCGLVFDDVVSESYVVEYVEEQCEEHPDGPLSEECAELMQRSYVARIVKRYWAVNMTEVNLRCDEKPKRCKDTRRLEKQIRRSHNHAVERRKEKLLREVKAAYDERAAALAAHRGLTEANKPTEFDEERARRKAIGALFLNLGAALNNQGEPLVCCDGEQSPSCRAGGPVFKACCSHHGGLPPNCEDE